MCTVLIVRELVRVVESPILHKLSKMFNQGTNVEISNKNPLLQNRCYVLLNLER